MPKLQYAYIIPSSNFRRRPTASCVVTNILNGKYAPFLGVIDSGADVTSLSMDLLERLGIDPETLPEEPIGGIGGSGTVALRCDHIKISFLEEFPAEEHFPNGGKPVFTTFIEGGLSVIGQRDLLELCKITMDGPKRISEIEF